MMELIPEAHDSVGALGTGLGVALGGALLWGANLAVPHSHLIREHGQVDTRLVKSIYLVVIGLILHDVPEGFAMANAYIASPSLGLLVATALRSKRFLMGAAILPALAEPAGAVIGLIAVAANPALNAYFLAFAGGAMLFVSFHELVPMARRYGRMIYFFIGAMLAVAVHQLLALLIMSGP